MPTKTVDLLLEERNYSLEQLVRESALPAERVQAIVEGRWLANPAERAAIAAAFNCPVDDVSWGHTISPRNVRYHRYGLKEDF